MISQRSFWKQVGKWIFGILFILAGANHFRSPDMYMKIMPPYLPLHRPLVLISGVFEMALGALLLIPQISWLAAWGLIALLFAIFPANIYLYQHQEILPGPPLLHLLRLPMQGVLIWWAWVYTKREQKPESPPYWTEDLAHAGGATACVGLPNYPRRIAMSASETTREPSHARPLSPQRISEMAWGFAAPLILEAAIHNRVFDVLDSGAKTLAELAATTHADPRGLRAIANALVGFDLLRREGDRYALTEESATFLVSTKPSFQGGIYRHMSTQLIPAWLELDQIVRSGKVNRPVNEQGAGAEFFAQFVEDILPLSYRAAQALADALADQLKPAAGSDRVTVLDIAAGSGVWGIALAQKSPAVHVTAVDWPKVTPITRRIAGRFGVGDRFHTVEGDLLEAEFGTGHQVATLGHILHSEGEARSRTLLKKVFDALASGGTIAIAEFVPNDDRTGPPAPLIFAVNMLVNTDLGDTFTFSEISGWLKEAGFEQPRQLDAPSVSPLILADKPTSG